MKKDERLDSLFRGCRIPIENFGSGPRCAGQVHRVLRYASNAELVFNSAVLNLDEKSHSLPRQDCATGWYTQSTANLPKKFWRGL